ncbi:RNA polymerase II transcription factor B 52 kDa subunit, partial [Coemansia sp. 'formosensis']
AILHFMVGHSADAEPPSESVRGILRMSRLMEDSAEGMKITNSGFQFLLQDPSSQVWTVLLQYLRLAEMQDMDVVEVLNFMFQLVSLQLGRPYSTEALTRNQQKMLAELCSFGLLYQDSVGAPQFYPTHLITSLSSGSASHSAPLSASGSATTGRSAIPAASKGELAKPSDQGFIILETNCRVYAYTQSALQIAILNLFVHLVNRFPNFITGALTRDSVRRALSRGITADQIITFLTTHAHPQMQGRTPVLPITVTDQIRLWEQERNRLRPTAAYFYKDFGQKAEYERMFKYAQDIGVILWASNEKRQLVVTRQGHAKIAELVKSQRAAAAAAAAAAK